MQDFVEAGTAPSLGLLMGVGEGGNMYGVSWKNAEDVGVGGEERHWLEKAEEVMEGLKQTHASRVGSLFSP